MEIIRRKDGKLKMDVSSEGNYISAGTEVIVEEVCDNFKNLFIRVTSPWKSVRLPYVVTNVDWLV